MLEALSSDALSLMAPLLRRRQKLVEFKQSGDTEGYGNEAFGLAQELLWRNAICTTEVRQLRSGCRRRSPLCCRGDPRSRHQRAKPTQESKRQELLANLAHLESACQEEAVQEARHAQLLAQFHHVPLCEQLVVLGFPVNEQSPMLDPKGTGLAKSMQPLLITYDQFGGP